MPSVSSRCLTQQVPEGVYKERDAYLRQFLKEYPHIQNSVWKQMAATASRAPLVRCTAPIAAPTCMNGRDPHCVNGTTVLAVLVGIPVVMAVVPYSWCDIWNFWKLYAGCVLIAISLLFPSPPLSFSLISHLYSLPSPLSLPPLLPRVALHQCCPCCNLL